VSTAQHQSCQQPSTATLHDSFFFLKSFTDMSDDDLFRAAQRGDLEAVRQLLHEGAPRSVFESAMKVAVWNDHADIVAEMARFVDYAGQTAKYLALAAAARNGQVRVVRTLIRGGVDVQASDVFEWTALHTAALYGQTRVVAQLLHFKADVHARTSRGGTALAFATTAGHAATAAVLRRFGAGAAPL